MTSQIRLNILEGRYRARDGGFVRASTAISGRLPVPRFPVVHARAGLWRRGLGRLLASRDGVRQSADLGIGVRRAPHAGLSEPEIRAWLKQPGIRDARFRNSLFAPRYAVLVNASDHMPPEDLGALDCRARGRARGSRHRPRIARAAASREHRRHPPSCSNRLMPRALPPAGTPREVGVRVLRRGLRCDSPRSIRRRRRGVPSDGRALSDRD